MATKLINKPTYKFYRGGLIQKYLKGGTPTFFRLYGINPDKFKSMFNALRSRGYSNLVAFEVTWLSMKETPKTYYSFGKTYNDVNGWADHAHKALLGPIYNRAVGAKNFLEYRKATLPYNKLPFYTNWLLLGRDLGKQFINTYIQENNLGKPVVMNNIESDNNFETYYT